MLEHSNRRVETQQILDVMPAGLSCAAGEFSVFWQFVRAGRWLICWRWRQVLFAMHVGGCEVWLENLTNWLDVFAVLLLFEVDGVLIDWYFRLLAEDLSSYVVSVV